MNKNRFDPKFFLTILVIVAVAGILGFRIMNDGSYLSGEGKISTIFNFFSKKPKPPALKCGLIHPANETYDDADVVWLTKVWFDGKPAKRPLTRIKLDGEEIREKNDKKGVLRDLVIESRKRTDGGTALILGIPVNGGYFPEGSHGLEIDVRDSLNRSCTAKAQFKTTKKRGQTLSSADDAISIIKKAQAEEGAEEQITNSLAQATTKSASVVQTQAAQGASCSVPVAAYFQYFADPQNGWYPAVRKMADSSGWFTNINAKLAQSGLFSSHSLVTPAFSLKYQTLQPQPVPFGLINQNGFAMLYDTNGDYWGAAHVESAYYYSLGSVFTAVNDPTNAFYKFAASLKANHPYELVAIYVDDIIKVRLDTTGGIQQKCSDVGRAVAYPDLGVIVAATFDDTIQLSFVGCQVDASGPMANSTFSYMAISTLHESAHLLGLDDIYGTGYSSPNLMSNLSLILTRDQAANFVQHTQSAPGLDCSAEALDFFLDYGHPFGTNPSYDSKTAFNGCGNGLLGLSGLSPIDLETCEIEYIDASKKPKDINPFNYANKYSFSSFGQPVTSSGLPSHTLGNGYSELCYARDPNNPSKYCQRVPHVGNNAIEYAGGGFEANTGSLAGNESCESSIPGSCPSSWLGGKDGQCVMQPQTGFLGIPNYPPPGHQGAKSFTLGQCFKHCGDGLVEAQYGELCDPRATNNGCTNVSYPNCSQDCRTCTANPNAGQNQGSGTVAPDIKSPGGSECGNSIKETGEDCDPPGQKCQTDATKERSQVSQTQTCQQDCSCPPKEPIILESPPVQ